MADLRCVRVANLRVGPVSPSPPTGHYRREDVERQPEIAPEVRSGAPHGLDESSPYNGICGGVSVSADVRPRLGPEPQPYAEGDMRLLRQGLGPSPTVLRRPWKGDATAPLKRIRRISVNLRRESSPSP